MELDITKEITKNRVIEAIELSIVNVTYRTLYKHIWVYEKDGVVSLDVLLLILEQRNWNLNNNGTPLEDDTMQLGTPLPEKESFDDEMYIEAVATVPKCRGQVIASQLLKHLISTDTTIKWGLDCDYANEGALKLYEKIGFEDVGEMNLYGHRYHHMTLN